MTGCPLPYTMDLVSTTETTQTKAEELAICYHRDHCGATATRPCGIAKYRKQAKR